MVKCNQDFWKNSLMNLTKNLIIIDRDNRRMNVKFNGSVEHPLMLEGWTDMRDFFNITGNKLMLITYVGDNRFVVDVHPHELQPDSLPSYHTYRHFATDPVSFDVILTQDIATKSQLVSN
jgi:hypothetical protein